MKRILIIFVLLTPLIMAVDLPSEKKEISVEDFMYISGFVYNHLNAIPKSGIIDEEMRLKLLDDISQLGREYTVITDGGDIYHVSWVAEAQELSTSLEMYTSESPRTLQTATSRFLKRIDYDRNHGERILLLKAFGPKTPQGDNTENAKAFFKSDYDLIQPGSEEFNKSYDKRSKTIDKFIEKIHDFFLGINKWFMHRFEFLPKVRNDASFRILNWVIVIFVIGLLAVFFISLLPVLKRGGKAQENDPSEKETVFLSMSDALKRGDTLARSGMILEALRELLTGLFMGLDELGRIQYRKSRTNREYNRMIKWNSPSHSDFASQFLPYMDEVMFAGRVPLETEYSDFRQKLYGTFQNEK